MAKVRLLVALSICAFLLLYTNAFPYSGGDYPQRIISLGPDITEELYILGAEARLVGCTMYCQRPPEAKKKEKVGTIMEISVEKVLSLHPDLVLAISLTNPAVKEKLTGLGIKESFIHNFIEFAGGINMTKDLKNIHYSRERVLKDDPDVIIIATMGINGEKEKKVWQGFKTLKAVKDDRIYFIDSELLCSPTTLSFAETVKEISKILHPYDEYPHDEYPHDE